MKEISEENETAIAESEVKPLKILRSKQVCEKIEIGMTTLYTKHMKSDDFPKAKKLGGTNAWLESEIDLWIKKQFEETSA